jgi:histidyl-tRNA synthetase
VITSGDLDRVVEFADSEAIRVAVDRIRAVLERADRRGVREFCTLSLTTARGLDYYTGIVFECFETSGAVNRSIFGGGRYDDLIGDVGGPDTPAVGFAIGDATLEQLCRNTGCWPTESLETDYYVLRVGDVGSTATRIARDLRKRGHVVETDLSGRGFGGQLDYADGIDAETVVIVGERDLADGEITIKDMESGDQVAVPVDSFPGEYQRPTYAEFA